jgi:hypothetical protein
MMTKFYFPVCILLILFRDPLFTYCNWSRGHLVYILDPEAFTIMDSLGLPAPPVFLNVTGIAKMPRGQFSLSYFRENFRGNYFV